MISRKKEVDDIATDTANTVIYEVGPLTQLILRNVAQPVQRVVGYNSLAFRLRTLIKSEIQSKP